MQRGLILFFLFLPFLLSGKSYFYPKIKTEIHLEANGDVRILQERTYSFEGSFSWAFLHLEKKGAKDIIFNQIAELTPDGWQKLEPLEVKDSPKSLYIHWGYKAVDETKTFLLDYTIIGAVRRYSDVAEFYWKVIEEKHEKISEIEIKIFLPEPSPELFKVYIHSRAPSGTLSFNSAKDQVVVRQKKIPKNAFVEVRALTSPEVFTRIPIEPQAKYQKILSEEKRNFILSLVRKFILLPFGLILMIILPLVILLLFYFRYGREPKIQYDAIYEHEPPRLAPPVTIPTILHQKPEKETIHKEVFQGMFATLLDLATKGYITVQEINKREYQFNLVREEKIEGGLPFHQEVINFFFKRVSEDGKSFTDKRLKRYLQDNSKETSSFLEKLFDRAKAWWQLELKSPLLDPKSVQANNTYFRGILLTIGFGAFLFGIGLSGFFGGTPAPFILPVPLVVISVLISYLLGKSILRWSAPAYLEQRRWLNFRRFLTDFSAIAKAPITLLAIWEGYYVYSVVLGVAKKFLKNVSRLATERNTAILLPVWYKATAASPANLTSLAEGLGNFESFAHNFTNMMESFSTGTSSGGGFSGGGGGGGGGGASGAG